MSDNQITSYLGQMMEDKLIDYNESMLDNFNDHEKTFEDLEDLESTLFSYQILVFETSTEFPEFKEPEGELLKELILKIKQNFTLYKDWVKGSLEEFVPVPVSRHGSL